MLSLKRPYLAATSHLPFLSYGAPPLGGAADGIEADWDEALRRQRHRLSRRKYSAVLPQLLSYHNFRSTLATEQERYGDRNIARHVLLLTPVLDRLNTFLLSTTTIMQASGSVASFVWGVLMALIVVASKFSDIMEMIVDMFSDLTLTLDQLSRYIDLFPGDAALRVCMRALIDDYVGFCITALKFFMRFPIHNLLRIFWSTVERKFRTSKANIKSHVSRFERQRQLAVDQEVVRGARTVQEVKERIDAALPHVTIAPRVPESLYMVPYQRNPYFCGRDDALELLHSQLNSEVAGGDVHGQRATVVHGIGGLGKTQVAIEYTHRYRFAYDYIFWIRAETDAELSDSVAALARALRLDAGTAGLSRALSEMVKQWLEACERRWLLIFDNAEDWASLKPYWPSRGGALLLTSQNASLAQVTRSEVRLQPFPKAEGGRLLLKLNHHVNVDAPADASGQANRIADELGGLPLAIAHVAGYIYESKAGFEDFLLLFQERSNSAHIFASEGNMSTFQYEKRLGVVWDLALNRLERQNPDALRLVQTLSMLNPDGVPEGMLYGVHTEPELAFLAAPDLMRFQEMLRSLLTRHLVDRVYIGGTKHLVMHRSLQRSLLHRLDNDPERFRQTFMTAFLLIRAVFPRGSNIQLPQNDIWDQCERYSSHVMTLRAVYTSTARPPPPCIDFATMLSDCSNYFWERNLFSDGLRASDTAESICGLLSRTSGHEMQRANVHTIAASVRCNSGIAGRVGNLHRFQKALALRQHWINTVEPNEVTLDDVLNYAAAWGNLGLALIDFEAWDDVHAVSELAIAIRRRLLGDEHELPSCENVRNVAVALAAAGRYPEAMELIPKMEDMPQDGKYFVAFQIFHFLWANIWLSADHIEDAHERLLYTLDNRVKLFGPSARCTLDTYYLLAMLEQKRGKFEEAETHLRQSLSQPDEWPLESRIRAEFRLGQLILLRDSKSGSSTNTAVGPSTSGPPSPPPSPILTPTTPTSRHLEAHTLQSTARKTLSNLWRTHTTYLPPSTAAAMSEEARFDHLVPMEAGRHALGVGGISGGIPAGKLSPLKVMRVCELLMGRFGEVPGDAGDMIVSPAVMVGLLKLMPGVMPEEGSFGIGLD